MRVALVVVDGMFDSGLTGLLDVFATANLLRADVRCAPPAFDVDVVGVSSRILTGHGLQVTCVPIASSLPADLVIAPALGLHSADEIMAEVRHHPVLDWLAAEADRGASLAAACSGTFFLAETGRLDGVAATTSWWLASAFRARYPAVLLDDRLTVVEHGAITTAGAAFAHLDLALAIVTRHSPELGERVAQHLLLGDRAGARGQAAPPLHLNTDPTVTAFERWVRDHLDQPLQISDVAARIGVGERALQRASLSALGMSPMDFVHEIRIERATFLLRTTSRSPESIARAVGYRNAASLRMLVRRRRGVTLSILARPTSSEKWGPLGANRPQK